MPQVSTGFSPAVQTVRSTGPVYARDMPRRAHDFRGLTQPRRLLLLRVIQERPGLAAGALAQESGIPLNSVRDHLRVLEDEGLIRNETRREGARGRPPVTFHPVRDAASSTVAATRVAGAVARGRRYRRATGAESTVDADALRQIDVLYEHLDDAGLEPIVDERSLRFDLDPCRYQGLLDEDQELVCRVHAQLVRDVLRHSDGPLEVQRLDPFVTLHSCRLFLTLSGSDDGDDDA